LIHLGGIKQEDIKMTQTELWTISGKKEIGHYYLTLFLRGFAVKKSVITQLLL